MKILRCEAINFQTHKHIDIDLTFDEGITAFVGPNMSGKTTTGRALCWAMSGRFPYEDTFNNAMVRPISYSKNKIPATIVRVRFVCETNHEQKIYTATRRIDHKLKKSFVIELEGTNFKWFDAEAQQILLSLAKIPDGGSSLNERIKLFLRSVWLGVGQEVSFFSANSAKRKKILEAKNPSAKLAVWASNAADRIKETEKIIEEARSSFYSISGALKSKSSEVIHDFNSISSANEAKTLDDVINAINHPNNPGSTFETQRANLEEKVVELRSSLEDNKVRQQAAMDISTAQSELLKIKSQKSPSKSNLATLKTELDKQIADSTAVLSIFHELEKAKARRATQKVVIREASLALEKLTEECNSITNKESLVRDLNLVIEDLEINISKSDYDQTVLKVLEDIESLERRINQTFQSSFHQKKVLEHRNEIKQFIKKLNDSILKQEKEKEQIISKIEELKASAQSKNSLEESRKTKRTLLNSLETDAKRLEDLINSRENLALEIDSLKQIMPSNIDVDKIHTVHSNPETIGLKIQALYKVIADSEAALGPFSAENNDILRLAKLARDDAARRINNDETILTQLNSEREGLASEIRVSENTLNEHDMLIQKYSLKITNKEFTCGECQQAISKSHLERCVSRLQKLIRDLKIAAKEIRDRHEVLCLRQKEISEKLDQDQILKNNFEQIVANLTAAWNDFFIVAGNKERVDTILGIDALSNDISELKIKIDEIRSDLQELEPSKIKLEKENIENLIAKKSLILSEYLDGIEKNKTDVIKSGQKINILDELLTEAAKLLSCDFIQRFEETKLKTSDNIKQKKDELAQKQEKLQHDSQEFQSKKLVLVDNLGMPYEEISEELLIALRAEIESEKVDLEHAISLSQQREALITTKEHEISTRLKRFGWNEAPNVIDIQKEYDLKKNKLEDGLSQLSRLDFGQKVSRKIRECESLTSQMESLSAAREQFEHEIECLNTLKSLLAPNGETRTLALSNDIQVVVNMTNEYLSSLNLDHNLAIDLMLEKDEEDSGGAPVINIQFEIDGMSGKHVIPSESQRKIVSLCMDMAVMKLGQSDNFIIIDEPETGLDHQVRPKVIEFLRAATNQVILITNSASEGVQNTYSTSDIRRTGTELTEAAFEDNFQKIEAPVMVARRRRRKTKDVKIEDSIDTLEE